MSAINLKSWTPKFKVNEQPYYFHYQGYNINWKECLGHGLYGDVYKAECDLLPCAAKVLERHPDSSKISAMLDEKRFLLNSIRHPNIVQYLDIVVDSEHASNALVLLMELLDESLTQMLEPSRQSLALHTQLNICHDIALAISYLHSKNIIHRDLSSNNVLLNAGKKAKVADFCMFGVYATNGANTVPVLTSLNVHLRTPDYMPPEALEEPPRYKKKLDCYSEGVIMMQICTHQKEPIREERRSHLEQIDSSHPLLPLIKKCLSDHEDDRPSAADLCYILTELKKQYSDVRVRLPTTLHVGAQQISEDSGTSNSDTPENSISSLPLIMVEGGDHTPRSDYPRLATQTATMLEQLWYTGAPIPSRLMVRGAVVSNIYEAYFMNSSGEIWLYDSSDQHPWSIVNNNYGRSRQYSSIAIVSGILTVIGGLDDQGLANTISNTLLSLMEDDDDTKEWKEHFPPMSTARYFAAAVTTSQHLIVAEGIGEE